jgi:hypothetical protein
VLRLLGHAARRTTVVERSHGELRAGLARVDCARCTPTASPSRPICRWRGCGRSSCAQATARGSRRSEPTDLERARGRRPGCGGRASR